ncbi:MAG: hypothetical protein ACRC62_02465 [Microcoleus sp.]
MCLGTALNPCQKNLAVNRQLSTVNCQLFKAILLRSISGCDTGVSVASR